jgi:hypothetical protein
MVQNTVRSVGDYALSSLSVCTITDMLLPDELDLFEEIVVSEEWCPEDKVVYQLVCLTQGKDIATVISARILAAGADRMHLMEKVYVHPFIARIHADMAEDEDDEVEETSAAFLLR